MPEARRLLAAVVVVATWTGGLWSVVTLEVLRARNWLCTVTDDGYAMCPDGNGYWLAYLVVAGSVAAVVLAAGVLGVARRLDRAGRGLLAADLAVLAVLPTAVVGGAALLAALAGSAAALVVGVLLVLPLATVLVWRRRGWWGEQVLWAALAVAGVLAALLAEVLAVTTVPGAGLLLVAAGLCGLPAGRRAVSVRSQQSHQSHN